jgi:putative DNA primase/helicase
MQITGYPGIATLGTSGLLSIEPPECTEIIIAADNDDAGNKVSTTSAQRLANSGRNVRIATPEYDGDDWNDVLQKDQDKLDELREQILNGKLIKAERRVLALPADEFLALTFPPRPLHLRPWLPKGGLVMIHATRGGGKTWIVLSIAIAVSGGQELMGWTCEQPGRVLYVDGELPGDLLQKRLGLFGPLPRDLLILSRDLFHQRRQQMF